MVLVVEMSTGQLVEDVRLALDGGVNVEFYSRTGGNVPLADEVSKQLYERMGMVAEWGV
jgi:hypothetical protein